jgi:hypothetical protein
MSKNGEKLYFTFLTLLGLLLLYYGMLDLHRRHNPPPEVNPYITDIYKGSSK